jgi:hypothetical protein
VEKRLILYHGSNQDFDAVDLSKSRDKRDFGRGFYTTTLREQAEDWAEALFDRHKEKEWLLMVQKNRTLGGIQHRFDVVQGPVANDKTARTI